MNMDITAKGPGPVDVARYGLTGGDVEKAGMCAACKAPLGKGEGCPMCKAAAEQGVGA